MRVDGLFVAGIGTWLPPAVGVQEALADERYDPADQAKNDYVSITVAGDDDAPPEMAVRAAREALARSGIHAADIALLLHGSLWYQGADFWPAASYIHGAVLGDEGRHAPAMDVQQMSNGSLAAVELAACYLAAGSHRRAALVTTADRLAPPGFDRWRSDLPGIVYGDGAAAVVLARDDGFARLLSVCTVTDSALEGMYRGDRPFGTVAGHAGYPVDNRTRRAEFAAASDVAELGRRIRSGLTDAVGQALAEAEVKAADLRWTVFPNLGVSTLRQAYLGPLGLNLASTTWEWGRRTGHVGAADQLIGLRHIADSAQAAPGDRVLLVGIGAGFSWTGAVVEFVGQEPCRTRQEEQ
jgi:3-oxoacyl-[acyl-carrier-protein] synthase III